MGKSAPSPPPAPDYVGAANAQGQANLTAGQQTASLNNPNVTTPYGIQTVNYTQTGPNGDYQPNITARSLRVSRTFSLGIAVPQLDNPVFSQIIVGAERGAREYGYSLLITHIEEGAADSDAYERLASTNRVDGLLVTTLDDNSVVLKAAKKAKVPFVLLNRSAQGVRNSIYFDSAAAARMAVEHLSGK